MVWMNIAQGSLGVGGALCEKNCRVLSGASLDRKALLILNPN